ncbi:helix-turn-helix domain-containing protein [Solilutibacter silvestris]|uniref:Helix-turn-helix protein n=1 Tax=Solilutibacter silvestris TaxID=1645665 RepID=A0A2K1Q295_9GAMM|nr:helix-turn-helix transcriptional regulator [Lysobacter silvestris]PNS09101.1 helix-turn-helix protein [Lysobacter silvestris]
MAKSLYRAENLELAALLRQLREDAGMVQTTLAKRLGRNQTFVSNVELAIRRLDLVELRDYCAGLDISLRDLVDRWELQIVHTTKAGRGKLKRKPG